MNEQQMQANAECWINSWLKEFSVKSFDEPLSLLNRDNVSDAAATLDEIIRFCKSCNARPVMVIPPMYHTLAEKFTPQARHILIDNLLETMSEKTTPLFNYMDDEEFAHNAALFSNSFLLNETGAKLFTKRILSSIGVL
jgi:hypothetical protein